jgi:CheY-like chemotaxis protein
MCESGEGSAAPNKPPPVLVIDDETEVRRVIARMLERLGYRVLQAASGQEGIEQIAHGPVALVVMDLTMPPPNGVDLVRLLRDQHPELPIIVVSGYDGSESAARLATVEPLIFIPKPFSTSDLRAAVRAALGGSAEAEAK